MTDLKCSHHYNELHARSKLYCCLLCLYTLYPICTMFYNFFFSDSWYCWICLGCPRACPILLRCNKILGNTISNLIYLEGTSCLAIYVSHLQWHQTSGMILRMLFIFFYRLFCNAKCNSYQLDQIVSYFIKKSLVKTQTSCNQRSILM